MTKPTQNELALLKVIERSQETQQGLITLVKMHTELISDLTDRIEQLEGVINGR